MANSPLISTVAYLTLGEKNILFLPQIGRFPDEALYQSRGWPVAGMAADASVCTAIMPLFYLLVAAKATDCSVFDKIGCETCEKEITFVTRRLLSINYLAISFPAWVRG
jgi:hypothetical protein